MKLPLVALGIGGMVLFSGPRPEFHGALTRVRPVAPAWLMMPSDTRIYEIDYHLGQDHRVGQLQARIRSTPDAAMRMMQARFEKAGFETERVEVLGASEQSAFRMMQVAERSTRREATVVAIETPHGRELLITFRDELATPAAREP